jgi:DnaK suppressor protein
MHASDLTPEQIEELCQDLLAERQRLEVQLESMAESAKPVQLSAPIGRLSRMDAIGQQQMSKASRQTMKTRLSQIRASIEAHKKGKYGECRSCEEPIGYPRLKARPEAPFCLSCQDSRER